MTKNFYMNLKLILLSLLVVSSNTQHIGLIDRLVNISWVNEGGYTFFVAKAKLNSGITPSNAWFGVGFNDRARMVCWNFCIC